MRKKLQENQATRNFATESSDRYITIPQTNSRPRSQAMKIQSDIESTPYRDRSEAGRILASLLRAYRNDPTSLVVALPRGGVPVGYEIARELEIEFDVFVSRKLCTSFRPRKALGAIASGCLGFRDPRAISAVAIPSEMVDEIERREWRELWRHDEVYHRERPQVQFADRTIILVDDYVTSGCTLRAAIRAIRSRFPAKIIVALPVAPAVILHQLRKEADQLVCPESAGDPFRRKEFYQQLAPLNDEQVCDLLRKSR